MKRALAGLALALVIAACGGSSDAGTDLNRYCELAWEFADSDPTETVPDADLEEWIAVAPDEIRQASATFVDITQTMRDKISNADPAEQLDVTREALGEALANPDFEPAGIEIENFTAANCPDR